MRISIKKKKRSFKLFSNELKTFLFHEFSNFFFQKLELRLECFPFKKLFILKKSVKVEIRLKVRKKSPGHFSNLLYYHINIILCYISAHYYLIYSKKLYKILLVIYIINYLFFLFCCIVLHFNFVSNRVLNTKNIPYIKIIKIIRQRHNFESVQNASKLFV